MVDVHCVFNQREVCFFIEKKCLYSLRGAGMKRSWVHLWRKIEQIMRAYIGVILAVIVLMACSPKLMVPVQADADRSGNASLAELQKGRTLYTAHCGNCHPMKRPDSRSVEEWKSIVPRMVKKVNKQAGSAALTGADEALILQYVSAMSQAPAGGGQKQ
jgi:cytochrome c2